MEWFFLDQNCVAQLAQIADEVGYGRDEVNCYWKATTDFPETMITVTVFASKPDPIWSVRSISASDIAFEENLSDSTKLYLLEKEI